MHNDRKVVFYFSDRRLNVETAFAAFNGDFLAAVKDLAALSLYLFDRFHKIFDRFRVYNRSHDVLFVKRVADLYLFVCVDERFYEFRLYRLLDDDSSCRGASLTSGSDRTENDSSQSHVEVSSFVDYDCVVAAEFKKRSSESLCNCFADLTPHLRASSHADKRDPGVVYEGVADIAAFTDNERENAVDTVFVNDRSDDVLNCYRGERSF